MFIPTEKIAVGIVTISTLVAALGNSKTRKRIQNLITKPHWIIGIIIIICFSLYIEYISRDTIEEKQKKNDALKKAMIALIIAIFAELSLTIVPFWLVFIFSYYIE